MNTDVKILFGDFVAEEAVKGTFLVRKGSKQISPFEYTDFWWLTAKTCVLRRDENQRVDILFSNGRWFFGAFYAHELGKLGSDKEENFIAAIVQHGTHILNEEGDYLAFIPEYPRIIVLYDSFLVAFQQSGPTPRVRIYDLHGHLLAEGELWDAISEAMERA
jgi:hypothetical protein